MKKSLIKLFTASIIFSAFFTGCSSTKNVQTIQNDSYTTVEETEEDEEILGIDEYSAQPEYSQNNVTQPKKKKKNALEDFFTYGNKNDFVSSDVSYVFTNTITGSIKQKKATIMINPEKGTAGFGSTYMSAYYITQFNAESRKRIAAAVNSYLSDFDNKKLDRKAKKSFKKYGEVDIHLDWGTLSSSTPSNADGKASLGYMFEGGSPYFTITVYPLHNKYWDIVEDAAPRESMMLKYYFTKSLATDFVNMISEDKIAAFLDDYISDTIYVPVENDSYDAE